MLGRSLAAVAIVAFGAIGCGGSSGGGSSESGPARTWPSTSVTYVTDWHEYYSTWYAEVKVNGRDCIETSGYREASISCDWTPASPAPR